MIESLLNSLFHLFSNLYFYLYFFMLFPNLSLWLINMKEHELIWITMNKYEVTWRNMYYNEMNNKDLKRFPSEVWRPKLITISDSNKDWKWIWMKWIWEWILDGLVCGRQHAGGRKWQVYLRSIPEGHEITGILSLPHILLSLSYF